MTRPLRGPAEYHEVDHSTDAYDTIDWLVKNVAGVERAGGHGRESYEGFTVVHGACRPAPGAEGGGAREPDGRRLDGRRLVPLWRISPGRTSTTSRSQTA